MAEIRNNLDLAKYLYPFAPEKRQQEYTRLFVELSARFKVKSYGYLMARYEKWKADHGTAKDF